MKCKQCSKSVGRVHLICDGKAFCDWECLHEYINNHEEMCGKMIYRATEDERLSITEIVNQSHETAVDKGWYEEPKTFGELIALCHSELSEALEEFRVKRAPKEIHFSGYSNIDECMIISIEKTATCRKPEGIPIELADVVIRVADMCGYYGIDLEEAVRIKMEYNRHRPHRHGGKVI